jgi:NAD(P)-dependent dehydrogenase (short-subunit alcohol dehydrogenase family)
MKMCERVVLVTGALAGIGRATATAFARDGASVVVSGQRPGRARDRKPDRAPRHHHVATGPVRRGAAFPTAGHLAAYAGLARHPPRSGSSIKGGTRLTDGDPMTLPELDVA